MKTVIFAGGLGSRLQEETIERPKPMVEIGGRPILWHIMKLYASYGFQEFILALGYKQEVIKDYFLRLHDTVNDFSIDLATGLRTFSTDRSPSWLVNLIDTGLHTQTGGRLLRLKRFLSDDTFMVSYGDGLSDVDLESLLNFHHSHGRIATVKAVRPPSRFGGLDIIDGKVVCFREKPQIGEGWINGGFFVFNPAIFEYLCDDSMPLERSPLEKLSEDSQLMAYEHHGFFQPMDTVRERDILQKLWNSGHPPWVRSEEVCNVGIQVPIREKIEISLSPRQPTGNIPGTEQEYNPDCSEPHESGGIIE